MDIGGSYRNDRACATFVKFIALDLQQQLKKDISSANFFSVQVPYSGKVWRGENLANSLIMSV